MATLIENEKKFKVIKTTAKEIKDLGGYGICDSCIAKPEEGFFIAVLNSWYCQSCYDEWYGRAKNYPQDRKYERNKFDLYSKYLLQAQA